ncbi:MAG: type III-B CRISPR module RAMP protein Cmr6 [Campylobacteraceae bacterium]|jgi:CRISPR-associated protein Cmr6|nr:type III-B CRISPR module RAMP protein Cmr6 [Campylobacteraceae bacterium]
MAQKDKKMGFEEFGNLYGSKLQSTQHTYDKNTQQPKNSSDNEENNDFIPIDKKAVKLLKNDTANFSLSFTRLMSWKIENGTVNKIENSAEEFCKDANKKFKNIQNSLDLIHSHQKEIINQLGTFPIEIKARLTSPFISGLGAGHPNETGMILDRNTGCPFIQASSVKGVLRLAYALNFAEENPSLVKDDVVDDKELEKYFGFADTKDSKPSIDNKRGQLVVLDAYPSKAPKIKLDIMNPHYNKYYGQENKLPIETEDPIPIKFIGIENGAEFIFRAFFLPLKGENFDENDKKAIESAFEKAFSVIGFGGKTAIGYGRFEIISRRTA